MNVLAVALGGAVGACGRYALSLIPITCKFPLMTFITNVCGALIIGLIAGFVSERNDISQDWVLFLKTGVCGGFTTFSTFSLETYSLWENKDYPTATVYVGASLLLCLVGVWCGILLGKKLTTLVG